MASDWRLINHQLYRIWPLERVAAEPDLQSGSLNPGSVIRYGCQTNLSFDSKNVI